MKIENKIYLKKSVLFSLILIIIFLIIGNVFFARQYKTYTKNYNNTLSSIITLILDKYPNINRDELMGIINSEEVIDSDILSRYGIDIEMDSLVIQNDNSFKTFVFIYNGIFILFVISLTILYLIYDRKQTKEIKKIVKCLEEINRKKYAIDIDENTEDEFSILKNEVYKTTIMLKEAAENSKEDKLKLKDSLSDISHQLKTPLTSINIMLDNILDDSQMDDKTKEKFIQNVKREVTNISLLVGDILKLSRFDADVIRFERRETTLEEIIKKAISNVEMMAEIKNININFVKNSDNKIFCDFKWQAEAITNILKNCIEHSNDGVIITIETFNNKVYKQILITDNGEGIDSKDLPHIFERFYKGNNSSKDSVGIGLALAKAIIEKDNGIINVSSTKGKETKFTIKYY